LADSPALKPFPFARHKPRTVSPGKIIILKQAKNILPGPARRIPDYRIFMQ
jgi:hypothetical protein